MNRKGVQSPAWILVLRVLLDGAVEARGKANGHAHSFWHMKAKGAPGLCGVLEREFPMQPAIQNTIGIAGTPILRIVPKSA